MNVIDQLSMLKTRDVQALKLSEEFLQRVIKEEREKFEKIKAIDPQILEDAFNWRQEQERKRRYKRK